jgi:hypothetical protein
MSKPAVSINDDQMLLKVLRRAWRAPFTLACDFARQHTAHIALAACKGFITTRIASGVYGRTWLITGAGLRFIRESEVK